MENVYKINYTSRIAARVLWPLVEFRCLDKEDLYNFARKIDWGLYLNVNQTFAIDANVSHKNLRNSLYAALVVKDAICDYFRDKCGKRPSIDTANPDVQLNLFILNTLAVLSLDTSGAPLYKRGYRKESVEAPIQENIAAGILQHVGYQDSLSDPFCGSGTFLIEAAMKKTNTPAGFWRKSYGFFHMPEYNETHWLAFKKAQDEKIIPLPENLLFGSDINITPVKRNVDQTPFKIIIAQKNVRNLMTPASLIVCNPPYGKRLSSFPFEDLATYLKRVPDARVHVLCTDADLLLNAGLKISSKIDLMNGGLPVCLFTLK